MPRPPGIIDRVNYVVRSWDNPCNLPWAVVVETALPAALQAVVAVACFGFLDVVRFIFRPARLRSGRHGRRGRKGRRSRSPLAFLSRTVRKLPPLAALRQRKVTQGVRTLWVIDGIGQRLLWWWLVIDVSTAFFYNWTLMIQKTEKCQAANGPGAALASDASASPIALQTWPPIAYPTTVYERGNANVGGFAFSTSGGNWSATASAVYTNTSGSVQRVQMRVRVETLEGTIISEADAEEVQPDQEVSFVAVVDYNGAANGAVEIQLDQGFGEVREGDLFVFGHAVAPNPPVKFSCPFLPDVEQE